MDLPEMAFEIFLQRARTAAVLDEQLLLSQLRVESRGYFNILELDPAFRQLSDDDLLVSGFDIILEKF
jgi:hypothetical protein